MKTSFLFLVFILVAGCGPTKLDKTIIPTPVPTISPKVVAALTAIPTKSTNNEADITDGKGHTLSSGDGRSLFVRFKKHKSRRVVHQVSKGLFIGGEK